MASFYNWNNEKLDTSIEENLPKNKCTAEPRSALDLELLQDTFDKGISILILAPFGTDSSKSFCFSVTDLEASIEFAKERNDKFPYNFFTNKSFTEEETNQIYTFLNTINSLKSDDEIIFDAIKQNGLFLEYASYDLRNNKKLVLAAVTQNGFALQFASPELRNDQNIVNAAITQNGLSYEFVGEELREDHDIINKALSQNGLAIKFVDYADFNQMVIAVKQNGLAIQYIEDIEEEEYRVLATVAVKQNGLALQYINDSDFTLKQYTKLTLSAVKQNGLALEFAMNDLNENKDVVLAAITQNTDAIEFASDELRDDPELMSIYL